MTHCACCVEILHKILDNIAYTKQSNDVTLFQLYPLTNAPRIQPIPHLYKNHLMGLFLELKLLAHGTQLRTRSVDKWNELISQQSYTFNQSRKNRKTTIELSVNSVNAKEVKQRKQLTKTEKSFLDKLRKKCITHCDHQDSAPEDNDVNPITVKRTLTDSANTDLSSDTLETILNLSNKQIRTHHVGMSGFKICARPMYT